MRHIKYDILDSNMLFNLFTDGAAHFPEDFYPRLDQYIFSSPKSFIDALNNFAPYTHTITVPLKDEVICIVNFGYDGLKKDFVFVLSKQ